MNYYLPTYEECLKIVKNNEAFKIKEEYYNGKKISIFNYMLAKFTDFETPIENEPEIKAYELRGLTFVHESETEINRFLMLHKFFNLNQTKNYMYEDLKYKNIKAIEDKRDGSMISFIKVGEEIIPKTKMSIDNDQTNIVKKILLNNINLTIFIKECLSSNLIPIFELTSPFNKIVLQYNTDELKLIKLRDSNTGEYLNIKENILVKKYKIDLVDNYDVELFKNLINKLNKKEYSKNLLKDFSNILNIKKEQNLNISFLDYIDLFEQLFIKYDQDNSMIKVSTEVNFIDLVLLYNSYVTNIEGLIIITEDDLFFKAKTDWYFRFHQMLTTDISREDFIIKKTLEEEIDDIIALLEEGDMTRNKVTLISKAVSQYFNHTVKEIWDIVKEYDIKTNRKELAEKMRTQKYFGFIMSSIGKNEEHVEKLVKEQILKDTYHLEKARVFVKDLGVEI